MTSVTLVPVTESYLDWTGQPKRGAVRFDAPQRITTLDGATVFPDAPATLEIDATGLLSGSLVATDDPSLSLTGWQYTVTEQLHDGSGTSYPLTVSLAAAATGMTLSGGAITAPGGSTFVGFGVRLDNLLSTPYIDTALATGGLAVILDPATGVLYADTTVTSGTTGVQRDPVTGQLYVDI